MLLNYSPHSVKSSPASKRRVGGSAGGSLVKGVAVNLANIIPVQAPLPSINDPKMNSNRVEDEEVTSNDGDTITNGTEVRENGADGYDVPDEVFAFLSRSEQQKLRGNRK